MYSGVEDTRNEDQGATEARPTGDGRANMDSAAWSSLTGNTTTAETQANPEANPQHDTQEIQPQNTQQINTEVQVPVGNLLDPEPPTRHTRGRPGPGPLNPGINMYGTGRSEAVRLAQIVEIPEEPSVASNSSASPEGAPASQARASSTTSSAAPSILDEPVPEMGDPSQVQDNGETQQVEHRSAEAMVRQPPQGEVHVEAVVHIRPPSQGSATHCRLQK